MNKVIRETLYMCEHCHRVHKADQKICISCGGNLVNQITWNMEIDNKAVYLRALGLYGKESQIRQTMEEMAELQLQLCKNSRNIKNELYNKMRIAEEIADVKVMLEQMILLYDIESDVNIVMEQKIRRLSERMEM